MEINEIKSKLRGVVADVISRTTGMEFNVSDEDSLIDGGVIDSLSMVGLISSLEMEFEIFIHPAELSIDNFDNINKISDFILAKKNGNGQDFFA